MHYALPKSLPPALSATQPFTTWKLWELATDIHTYGRSIALTSHPSYE